MHGRWYGVRGRRFVRPALMLTTAGDDSEVRALAELDHKPWTAEEGEPWTAVFTVELDLGEVATMELTVAPDITVALNAGEAPAGGEPARAVRSGPGEERGATRRRRPGDADDGPRELDRLRARLTAASEALERERERRRAGEEALEAERAQGRRLRMELGQLAAELELARAGREQAASEASELESARRELLELRTRVDQLTRERDRAAHAGAETTTALHRHMGALESAREALAERDAANERLRRQLAESEHPHRPSGSDPPADAPSGRAPAAPPAPRAPVAPSRPVNPSLRHHRTYWLGRLLALLVLAGVIVAILLVIQGTLSR